MKNLLLYCLCIMAVIFIFSCQPSSGEHTHDHDHAMTAADSVARGKYLAAIMDCGTCHTPKVMTAQGPAFDTTRLLAGFPANNPLPPAPDPALTAPGQWVMMTQDVQAYVGPWGTSFAANLTPHETGLGNWEFENFEKAIRHGKFKGLDNSRMLLPPMPWQEYAHLTDEDLACLWAYLQSIPAIENVVPAPVPPATQG